MCVNYTTTFQNTLLKKKLVRRRESRYTIPMDDLKVGKCNESLDRTQWGTRPIEPVVKTHNTVTMMSVQYCGHGS